MSKDEKIESMADLLRRGATLTDLSCPACSSPLFRLQSGQLWCVQCQKQVVKEEEMEITSPMFLNTLEVTVLTKIQEVEIQIKNESNLERLNTLSNVLLNLLEIFDRISRMKRRVS